MKDDLPFAMVTCALNLLDPNADTPRLVAAIRAAIARLGGRPALIVVDTLAATFAGGDENGNDMVSYVNNMGVLRDEFQCLVAVVHHRPKDQANDTLRGHSSLIGAVDTILRVEGSDIRTVMVTKQKDGEEGDQIAFRLKRVHLGLDEEGQPVVSAIVDYVTVAQSKPLTRAAAAVLQALTEMVDEAEGSSVLEDAWRDRWEQGLPFEMQNDARRKAWNRAKITLNQVGLIKSEAGCWSIVPVATGPGVMDFSPMAIAA